MPPLTTSAIAAESCDSLCLFTWLWAQQMVLQVVRLMHPLMSNNVPIDIYTCCWPTVMASACFSGIVLPASTFATMQLMITTIVVLWFTGSQSNHVFMDMVVCLAILATYSSDRLLWRAQAAHAMRAFLVALYLVTALHKMNSDWDKPQHSCCTLMLGGILALSPLQVFQHIASLPMIVAPHLAVITELVLPLLVMSKRLVRFAAVLGCGFHMTICQMLSPMSVYPFSLLMAPPYVFLIPDRAVALSELMRPWTMSFVASYAMAVRLWTPIMAEDLRPGFAPFEYPPYGAWAAGVAWCSLVYVNLIAAALWAHEPGFLVCVHSVVPTIRGKIIAIGVLVFGLTPYFGVRTHPALAMFSNLRTEGGHSNHLFLGDDFDLLGWQRDYVTVHETDIPSLQLAQVDLAPLFTNATKEALSATGVDQEFWITPPLSAWPHPPTREFRQYSFPFLELRRRVAPLRRKGMRFGRVRYTRTIARAKLNMPWLWDYIGIENPDADEVRPNLIYDLAKGQDPELEEELPWWLALIAKFRTFDVDRSPCRH